MWLNCVFKNKLWILVGGWIRSKRPSIRLGSPEGTEKSLGRTMFIRDQYLWSWGGGSRVGQRERPNCGVDRQNLSQPSVEPWSVALGRVACWDKMARLLCPVSTANRSGCVVHCPRSSMVNPCSCVQWSLATHHTPCVHLSSLSVPRLPCPLYSNNSSSRILGASLPESSLGEGDKLDEPFPKLWVVSGPPGGMRSPKYASLT